VAKRGRFRKHVHAGASKVKTSVVAIRKRMSTGGAKMPMGQVATIAAATGLAAAGAEGLHHATGWSRPVTGGLMTGVGAIGLVAMPDGTPQALAAGITFGGTAYTVGALIKDAMDKRAEKKKEEKQKKDEADAAKALAQGPDAKQLPAGNAAPYAPDVQGAFDAARAINRSRREADDRPSYWDPYGDT
jgi:hypothetical protein